MGYHGADEGGTLADDPLAPTAPRLALPLVGLPPRAGDLGHPSDPWSALEGAVARDNAAALHLSLFGTEQDGDTEIEAHDHATAEAPLDWVPLCRLSFGNSLGGSSTKNGAVYLDQTTETSIGWGLCQLPEGRLTGAQLYARAKVSAPRDLAAGTLALRLRLLGSALDGDPEMGGDLCYPITIAVLSTTGSLSREWVEAAPAELRSDPALQGGRRLVYVQVLGRVSAGSDALLHEVQLGWRYGR